MRVKYAVVGLASLAIHLAFLAQSRASEPEPLPTDSHSIPPELQGLRDRWQKAMADLDVPGMAVVVVRGDQVIYLEAFGLRDPAEGLPVTPDTLFYIASCTKTFNAMAVLALAEEGKLKLDAPVKLFLPRFQVADAALTQTVTIRDLLSHAKGISSEPVVLLDAFTGEITEDRYYRWIRDAKATGSFQYNNVHYTLIGRIIEAVTGKPWKDFLADRILTPAGMTRTTGYASKMYADSDSAVPCDEQDGKPVRARVVKSDRTMHAAGGMGSSANDLARWLQLNLNGGVIDGKRIVSQDSIKAMQTLQAKAEQIRERAGGRTREGYGFGWNVGAFKGHKTLDHGGGYVGTSAQITILPDKRIGVAVLCNAGGDLPEMAAMDVVARLLNETIDDALPRIAKQTKQRRERRRLESLDFNAAPLDVRTLALALDKYAGRYENADLGSIEIRIQDARLAGTMGDLPLRFSSLGQDAFQADTGSSQDFDGRFIVDGQAVKAISITLPNIGEVSFNRQ